jgi:hypothetical protein
MQILMHTVETLDTMIVPRIAGEDSDAFNQGMMSPVAAYEGHYMSTVAASSLNAE